jgi:hypothetical protein
MNVHRRIAHGLKGLDTDFLRTVRYARACKNHSTYFLGLTEWQVVQGRILKIGLDSF